MGTIRESDDPEMRFPSSLFGFGDLPEKADILLDDICQKVLIKRKEPEPVGTIVDIYTYDEIDSLSKMEIRAARAGRWLKCEKKK